MKAPIAMEPMMRTKLALISALAGPLLIAPAAAQNGPAAADKTLGAALLSAVVAADGTLARGAGAVSSVRSGAGAYMVTFNRPLTVDCTTVATVGGIDTSTFVGSYAAAKVTAGEPEAFVGTSDHDAFIDRPFHLIVFCAK